MAMPNRSDIQPVLECMPVFLKMFIMQFKTVVYEKLIEIVQKNKSSMNEHKDFILQKNIMDIFL